MPEKQQPNFEDALNELERIVQSMEEEELNLEQLVSQFERGTYLQRYCTQVLDEVQERIESLKSNPGQATTSPEPATDTGEADSPNLSQDDDELLF